MSSVYNLNPKRVFYYFAEISKIPRGSGNTRAISDFLVSFAKEKNLKYIQDDIENVIIYKGASSGYENSETVILQGHMDMVCEKNSDSDHDFTKDAIEIIVDSDYLRADGTTLGADDGIALSYMLAILEDDSIEHPAIEAVFTVDEEVGMEGAKALDASKLNGRRILNIDSEEEGILWSSCAGGARCMCTIPIGKVGISEKINCYEISVKGLLGGHSGAEIDKGRVNAICMAGELLAFIGEEIDYNLVEFNGGMKDNAIPREAFFVIAVDNERSSCLENKFNKLRAEFIGEHLKRETNMKIELKKVENRQFMMDSATTSKCVLLLNALPNGVVSMSADIENLVETSLNIGVANVDDNIFKLDVSLRSSVSYAKELLKKKVKYITESVGGDCISFGDYPAWEFRKKSELRDTFCNVYEKMFGEKMKIMALHAGLECGILTSKIDDADCVSFGPNILDIHTPAEKMSISSVERTYNLILEVLKSLK